MRFLFLILAILFLSSCAHTRSSYRVQGQVNGAPVDVVVTGDSDTTLTVPPAAVSFFSSAAQGILGQTPWGVLLTGLGSAVTAYAAAHARGQSQRVEDHKAIIGQLTSGTVPTSGA